MEYHKSRAILEAIQPGHFQTLPTLGDLSGMCYKTVAKYMEPMIEMGLVVRTGKGKKGSYQYRVNEEKAREMGYII